MTTSKDELLQKLREQISFGNTLIRKLQAIDKIEGVLKLQRKIKQEVHFLTKLQLKNDVKLEQLCCSNLRHLGALVDCALRPGVVAVCKNFQLMEESKLVIDIISDENKTWTKVIARNPKSLSALSNGLASYGARSILDQADDYLKGARQYPHMYKPPKVVFEFVSGIEEALANKLLKLGIVVTGDTLPNFDNKYFCDEPLESETSDKHSSINLLDTSFITDSLSHQNGHADSGILEIDTLNLDVTTMMAYVSNMTNGHCDYVFKQAVLTQQAECETQRPVKPILENLFNGKKLVCCQTAWDNFETIGNTLAGPLEKTRTIELKERLTILPDNLGGEDDNLRSNLKVRGHVRIRSKKIFNFGHRIKALTVSANDGFIRAAQQQGVNYTAFIHEARALTEGKEQTATKVLAS